MNAFYMKSALRKTLPLCEFWKNADSLKSIRALESIREKKCK